MANEAMLRELMTKLREVDQTQGTAEHEGISWDQALWRATPNTHENVCGTTMCAAGWTVLMDALKRDEDTSKIWFSGGTVRAVPEEIENWHYSVYEVYHTEDGTPLLEPVRAVRIPDRAIRLLELNAAEADALFYCPTEIDEIAKVIEEIIDGEYR